MHPHVFILTTVNLNQFSTNRIQFYWNNIYKNRAHTRNAMENSEHTHTHYWIYVHFQIQHVCMHIYLYYYCSNWNVRWCCAEAFPVGADLVGFCVLRFNISIPIRRRLFLNILWIVETVSFIFMSTENQCVPTFGRKEKDHLYTVTQSYLSLWFFTFQLRFGPLIFFRYILFGYLRFRYTQIWKW